MSWRSRAAAAGIALFLLAPATQGHAVNPDEILADAALEERARAISSGLRCLVCQNQSIDDSGAPLARDLRILVRERLTAGDSDREVVDFVVARYGEFVLLRPKFGVHTLLLWLGPALLAAIAAAVVVRRVRARPAHATAPLSESEEQRLRRAIDG
jgi:cytochrome c-type biogenesis protein CcmH